MVPDGRRMRITPETELVIEGFPRSSNSFAHAAFLHSQEAGVRVSHHTHLAGQVVRAARMQIPVLLVVRHPKDAVASLLVAGPHLHAPVLLREYIRFHETVLPVLDELVVATFDEVTSDLGDVVGWINSRYGTSYTRFDHTPENVRAVFASMDRWVERQGLSGDQRRRRVARPTTARHDLRKRALTELERPESAPLLDRASDVYERVVTTRIVPQTR